MTRLPLCTRAAAVLPAVILGAGLCMVGQPPAALAAPATTPAQTPAPVTELQEIPAQAVSLSATDLNLMAGSTEALSAMVDPADTTDPLSWASSDPGVADVSADGLVRAVKAGSATVTATAGEAQADCDVSVWQPVTSIALNRTAFSMEGGEVRQLAAECSPEDATNKAVTWESSNPKVASVNAQTGLVTGLAEGKTTITCKALDGAGAQKTCEVTVTSTAYAVDDVAQLQSQHPYANTCTDSWTYSIPGAYQLSVTFDKRTAVENTFDYIAVFDKNGSMLQAYTGTALAGTTLTVPGDTVRIQLITDDQVTDWGFAVTSVEQLYPPKEEKPSKPEQPSTPDTPDQPGQPDQPDNPDQPSEPSEDWNLVVSPDGTVASDNVTFQLPEAWVGNVDVNVSSAAGDEEGAQELQISLAGQPDLVLASFALTDAEQSPAALGEYDVPVATWDNGNGQQLELSVVNWAAIAHNPATATPDAETLAQLVDLSTGGSMTLEQAQQAQEVPAPPTYGADELVASAEVPLYVDGKVVGLAKPAAAAVPALPDTTDPGAEIPAANGDEAAADQPAADQPAADQPAAAPQDEGTAPDGAAADEGLSDPQRTDANVDAGVATQSDSPTGDGAKADGSPLND